MPLLGSIRWHVNILLHLMVVFVACVNGFHGSKPNIVYICKQECLGMGCEHQYKQSSLNMSDNRVGNNQLSPFITPAMLRKCIYFIVGFNCGLVLKPITAWSSSQSWLHDVMATYHSTGLQRSWQGSGAQCFVYATTIELSQLKECLKQPHQVLFACGHRAATSTVVTSCVTDARVCVDCLSDALTKWNFHFLVGKWVSPSAFVWYLFVQHVWQEQCTLINISAFTSR